MKVVSINVGRPREIAWRGETVRTSIFKASVEGRVSVLHLNVQGDEQSDLKVHGGQDKAVYAYPMEHYGFWREELPDVDLGWGAFGENLTTEGLTEESVRIGEHLRIGSAELVITQPRMPCYKLALRFDRLDIVTRFLRSGRTGFYMAVVREGDVGAGDAVTRVAGNDSGLTVAEIVRLHTADVAGHDLLRRASELEALPEGWRDHFRRKLREQQG